MLFSKEWYLINAGTAGTVIADAHFITDGTAASQRRVWGQDYGFPPIKSVLGVEALAAGTAAPPGSHVVLSGIGGGLDANWDRWEVPIPFYSVGTADINQPNPRYEAYDNHLINMPYPDGCTLADGTVSKVFANAANTYIALVFYQQAGPVCLPPSGGQLHMVKYDKGGDSTTIVWNELENAAQNTPGELEKDHLYRLLWGSFDAESVSNTEALIARVTVPGYPALMFPGAGGNYHPKGSRRIMFLDDSILLRGDTVHKVEGHIGTACQPTVNLAWQDMGKLAGK